MNKISLGGLLASVLFVMATTPALAAFSFTNLPSSMMPDDQITVDVIYSGTNIADKIYFLRAAFFPIGTTNYFGYTQNNIGNWNNTPGNKTDYLMITTDQDSSWSGQFTAKLDLLSPHYSGPGLYGFKIGRYTQEGSTVSWSDHSEEILVLDIEPTPTPEPTPSPEPSQEPSPTPSPTPATDWPIQGRWHHHCTLTPLHINTLMGTFSFHFPVCKLVKSW